jgi:hypothetical protein
MHAMMRHVPVQLSTCFFVSVAFIARLARLGVSAGVRCSNFIETTVAIRHADLVRTVQISLGVAVGRGL